MPRPELVADREPSTIGSTVGSLAWSVAVIWALTAREGVEICSPPYRVTIREQPARVAWTSSPFFIVPALCLGLTCVLGMAIGAAAVAAQ